MKDSKALRQVWEEHPHYRYRGCAPDVDVPGRAAGNLALSLDAWHGADRDGSEPQKVREARQAAAVEVCLGCPVMVQCDAYASSVVADGGSARLAEPDGVWGGRTALERHRAFIAKRHEVAAQAPVRQMQTPQKLRVLEALARHVDAVAVAVAAGVDLRTANWQRSRLVTQLNLSKETATRAELLEAAVRQGLLEAGCVVGDDGSVPAVPPPSPSPRVQPVPMPALPEPVPGPGVEVPGPAPVPMPAPEVRARRPRRSRVAVAPGQLTLDDALAPVLSFPANRRMEAAA